ncbi:hypothetical protein BGX30_014814 [Mortierella sp. GBA39]|nr:hypothetical protein BGX30_014814 [Mortierella sp. GBA39]
MLGAAQQNANAGAPPPGGIAAGPNLQQPAAQAQLAANLAAANTPKQVPGQAQPAATPVAATPPTRGPLPKFLVAGMMVALAAATTLSQNNATLPTLESITLSAFTTAVTAAEAEVLRLPPREHPTLATALAVLTDQATTVAEQLAERYVKTRQFQSRLSTTLNSYLGTGFWRLRLNKRVQKKIFSDRVLSPEKLQVRQGSTSLRDDIEGVPYRVKDVKGWVRDADRFRIQLGSKRAGWNKTKLQHRLTQGSDIRSRLRGPLVFGLLDQQAGYAVEKLVRDRFASALSYAIEQQMGEHRHYINRLMARMSKLFHKPATPGRRGGISWLTPELQGLYSKIQLVHRNEQTIHQKALDETASNNPPISEYSCPVPELLYECNPTVVAKRLQQATLQQALAHAQEYETTSPTPKKKRVRCVSDEEEEKPSKRRCRRATSAPAVTRGKTNSSSRSASASAPAFGLSKKMEELPTP